MAKYKVGDRVVVREDLSLDDIYYMDDGVASNVMTESMMALRGQVVTIQSAHSQYNVVGNPYGWVDGMFAGLESDVCKELPSLPDIKALFG